MILTTRYVAPVTATVIENGAIRLDGHRIAEIGPASDVAGPTRTRREFGDAVIIPGFVNAHTHLELTDLAGQVVPTPNDFTRWLARLVERNRACPPTRASVQRAVAAGIDHSLRSGVTTVGDITRFPAWTRAMVARSMLRAVSFGEVIAVGSTRTQLYHHIDAALSADPAGDDLACALSAHAPYTVEPDALRECAKQSHARQARLCVHAAETREEEEFTQKGTGTFARYLRELGVWDDQVPIPHCGPIELLERCGALNERTVLAHANYVGDDDIERIAQAAASVAYCPRTHAAFGHAPHRFREMLAAGVNVCVGTDSLASSPTLSILDELRFLHARYPSVPAEDLLAMGTLAGARALGLDKTVGSIAVGKGADLVAIPLPPGAEWTELFATQNDPLAVISRGQFVHDQR